MTLICGVNFLGLMMNLGVNLFRLTMNGLCEPSRVDNERVVLDDIA